MSLPASVIKGIDCLHPYTSLITTISVCTDQYFDQWWPVEKKCLGGGKQYPITGGYHYPAVLQRPLVLQVITAAAASVSSSAGNQESPVFGQSEKVTHTRF